MSTKHRDWHRIGLTSLAGSAALVAVGTLMVALLAGASGAATTAAPKNKGKPSITGAATEGQILQAKPGTWRPRPESIRYAYQWQRCGSTTLSCTTIPSATDAIYALRRDDTGHTLRVVVAATNAGGSASALSERTALVGAAPVDAPVNTVRPTITGKLLKGNTLAAQAGTWTGNKADRIRYTWRRCNEVGGSCSSVDRQTGKTYLLRQADGGHTLRVLVSEENSIGKSSALSLPTGIVGPTTPSATAPKNTGEPTISGTPRVGERLTATAGSWSGTQPMSFARRWVRCGVDGGKSDGSNCPAIASATGSSHVLQSADVGFRLRVRVRATNSAGSATVASNPTKVVTAAKPTSTAPKNTGEPSITGTPRVGQVLRTTRGTWTGTTPIEYDFRWFRCDGGGKPDASDCKQITNANNASYVLREADAGFRIRSQVKATNDDGSATATSNPTAVVTSNKPVNTTEPSISGTAVVGKVLTANRGKWGGDDPITYSFVWLRCSQKGDNCSEIQGANDPQYEIRDSDTGRTIRVRVIARNDRGSNSAISNPTGVVGSNQPPPPPPGRSVAVGDLKAAGDRLVIASVQFSPNPVTSRTAAITVRVRITARGGRPVNGALVFMRATPRVVSGQTQATRADGWVTLTLIPNGNFPQ
ncbi:MAG: hypothetical protein OEW47_13335, partial [Thermoleophilia bacterium]|nr:hypothetical protein [Thermoleophilia bacterium]